MELINYHKEHGYFSSELYHLLEKKRLGYRSEEITPSVYLKEMRMTTSQRLATLNAISVDNIIQKTRVKPKLVLAFIPNVLIFQNFKINEEYTAKFSIRNIDTSPVNVNLISKESSFIKITKTVPSLISRLAPGITVTFTLVFSPQAYEDYTDKITFQTEKDQYVLPIIGIGPRPIFDMPDEIKLPKVLLKQESSLDNVFICNVGNVRAGITFRCKCPFSVSPKQVCLHPGEKCPLKVGFKTVRFGDVTSVIQALLETGEVFMIKVFASTFKVSIELEKQTVRFLDTYKTLARQVTFWIRNDSPHPLMFILMKNQYVVQDFEEKMKFATTFYNLKESEAAKFMKLVEYEIMSSNEHDRIYARIFLDEIHSLVADESISFHDTNFSINPIRGTLWPCSKTELTVNFNPQAIGELEAVAYIDVDGVVDRVPIRMKGIAIPPKIKLNLEILNMHQVYINKKYNYEVIACNLGDINGIITYIPQPTLFDSVIDCIPKKHCLRPGDKEIFVLSFRKPNQGPYFEEVHFAVEDKDTPIKLYLKGTVVFPALKFSTPCLEFGDISLGEPKTLSFEVINESAVDVGVVIKMPSDGPVLNSITLEDYAVNDIPKPPIPPWPKEFQIEPTRFVVEHESRVPVQVTLNPNLIRANQTVLELEISKSDSIGQGLPVTFNAVVPTITPAPEIYIRVCFMDYTYKYEVTFTVNEYRGYFTVVENETPNTLEVKSYITEGFIEPSSSVTLPIEIRTLHLGHQEYNLNINLFGCSQLFEVCHIIAEGVRPIVTVTPCTLHFGHVKLLTKANKILTLFNDSPVYVPYKIGLLNRDGNFQITPNEGVLEPESEIEINVSVYLVDAAVYTSKAVIQLERVKDIYVPVIAIGVGTSIVIGPLRDRIELGRHFTKIPLVAEILIENKGTKFHILDWNCTYSLPKSMREQVNPFFKLEPNIMKIAAGESLILTVSGLAPKPCDVKETWFMVGSIEGANKKSLLCEFPIIAEFVDPKIILSTNVVNFRYDYGPYNEYYKLLELITIKNISKLPLNIELALRPPFMFIKKQTYIVPPGEEDFCGCVCFQETDLNVQGLTESVGSEQSKIFMDCLTHKPVDFVKEKPLHFFKDIHKLKLVFNLTYSIQERMEDQDVIKIQILFDTTKHTTLKSKLFTDLLRIRFTGHKNKDSVKLFGHINFPNLLVMHNKVDFGCLLNGTACSKTFQIQNPTPLMVCYKCQWKKIKITVPTADQEEPYPVYKVSSTTQESMLSNLEENVSELHELAVKNSMMTGSELKTTIMSEGATKEGDSTDVELSAEEYRIRTLKKIVPLINTEYNPDFEWRHKFVEKKKEDRININDVMLITPHRGLLKPGDVQNIHIMFNPVDDMKVKGVLELEVLGGPLETILVMGKSADLEYTLNTRRVNFKIRSFHTTVYEDLIITNMSQLPFEFITYYENVTKNELKGTILELIPPHKVLQVDDEEKIKIAVRPGVRGFYTKHFILEIGHLPYITIEVFGWGVIPQIYLCLPRPHMELLPILLGYEAIQLMTEEYLDCIDEIFDRRIPEHVNSPLTEKCQEDLTLQLDWHICSCQWDGIPSVMDVELAIERYQVMAYLDSRPEILEQYKNGSRSGPIAGFFTTPYVMDFGVVITGSVVNKTLEIVNYGPLTAKLHFSKNTIIPLCLQIKLMGKINPGEAGKVDVTFNASAELFPELEQNVETNLNIEVPYGVTVPLKIRALCAVPFLATNLKLLDFGSVRCGDKVVAAIPLKNVGKPVCIWYATFKMKVTGENPITILDGSGKYDPGESGWLQIAFKPTMQMLYHGILVFRFHMNPNRLTIPVVGQGITPHVHIIGPKITFPPTLPWSQVSDIYFGITNPCPFPIQLIFAHVDDMWNEEDEIFNLLTRYYNKPQEILLPPNVPYDGLPSQITNFFADYTKRLVTAREKEAAANKALMKGSTAKRAKSPSKPGKEGKANKETPRKIRTEAEIINDILAEMNLQNIDPVKECFPDKKEEVTDEQEPETAPLKTKGMIIILHGSPCEESQCKELAYTLGIKLEIPTVNLDLAVIDALCECEGFGCSEIRVLLDEMYGYAHKKNPSQQGLVPGMEPNGTGEDFWECADTFDIYQRKIDVIASTKGGSMKKGGGSDKKKTTPSRNSAVSMPMPGIMFPLDMIQDMLTEYFELPKFKRGFILDCLTSTVVKVPSVVLTTVLRSKPTIHNIHLVLCHSDFNKWASRYEEMLKEAEQLEEVKSSEYSEQEIKDIVDNFELMYADEYESAPEDLKNLYIAYGLEDRRKAYYAKHRTHTPKGPKERKDNKAQSEALSHVEMKKDKNKPKKEEKWKPTSEYLLTLSRYNEYMKSTLESLTNIANNWVVAEQDFALPLLGFNGGLLVAPHKKAKKGAKSETQVQVTETEEQERGFPLTVIMCPCLKFKEALIHMFKNSPVVTEALKVEEEVDIFTLPPIRDEFAVLHPKVKPIIQSDEALELKFLDEPPIRRCECNQAFDVGLLDDEGQEQIYKTFSKWHCECGKRMLSTQTSTTGVPTTSVTRVSVEEDLIYPQPLPLHRLHSLTKPEKRVVLQPYDLLRCKYSFAPKVEGIFSVKQYVEINGWPESRTSICATGISDLPRLDSRPKKMFEKFCRRTIEGELYRHTYLNDKKVFEFGAIFVGLERVYAEEIKIELRNCSLLNTEIEIEFTDYASTVFTIDQTFVILEPGGRTKLKLSAAPSTFGEQNNILLLSIKENPEIIEINISCTGIYPIVEILPSCKSIDYGKLLLYRRQEDRFIVKNDSILPVFWKIKEPSLFYEDFIITKTSGIVPKNDNTVVPIIYIACNVGVISNKAMAIEIYDEHGRGFPMIEETLFLSGECYDVLVECAFENTQDRFLDFGNVKVNSVVLKDMFLLNRGKYNLYYKLKKVKNFPEPSILKAMKAIPDCGIMPPLLKLVAIEFECIPSVSVNLTNVPAFTCSLLDGSKDQVVVAKFPVCVTINSFYNTFTLFPLGELNFHIIAVGTAVMREVIINNTSKCPILFDIILPDPYQQEHEIALESAASKTEAKGKAVLKLPPMKCGAFIIMQEDNLLPPGTSRTLQLQFTALKPIRYEETIKFVVSDTCPAEASGVPLKLVGLGAVPTLDFWDLNATFQEHLIIKKKSDYTEFESAPHCVFVENNVSLYFYCVIVNQKHTANIYLYNNGVVACSLKMAIHQAENDIFSLHRYSAFITPLSHKKLGIIFNPKALKDYRAVLDITIVDQPDVIFQICLIGEGNIPRIEIYKPPMTNNKLGLITFPVTCLGSVTTRKVKFKNISMVKSKVTFELTHKVVEEVEETPPVNIFTLTAENQSAAMVVTKDNGSLDEKDTKLILLVAPQEFATVTVLHTPIAKGKLGCDLMIKIEDNPYEYFTIFCEAESFMEDIILMGLEMLSLTAETGVSTPRKDEAASTDGKKKPKSAPPEKKKKDSKKKKSDVSLGDQSSNEPVSLKYELDLGGCELNEMQKRTITMVNNGDKVYKFVWDQMDHVVMKPLFGYIAPGEEKDFVFMFFSSEPIELVKEPFNCTLYCVNDDSLLLNAKGMSWDNQQVITRFKLHEETGLRQRGEDIIKAKETKPSSEVLSKLSLAIFIKAKVAYTQYECSLNQDIVMLDTFIYQTRIIDFTVTNTGIVPLKITWQIVIDEEYPVTIDKARARKGSVDFSNEFLEGNSEHQGESIETQIGLPQPELKPEKVRDNKSEELDEEDESKLTLFSGSTCRDSVDTWFEASLPFVVNPTRDCLEPKETKNFQIAFTPQDTFEYKVRIKSEIDNLNPEDHNVSQRISARSLVPYVHLDLEASDYLSRRTVKTALPSHTQVLEFNVVGLGCFNKTFNVINPTGGCYEFVLRQPNQDTTPIHCANLKGKVAGGSSFCVTFSYIPTALGVCESLWEFLIPEHSVLINLLVVGTVREPEVMFTPRIVLLRNSIVGFTTTGTVKLKNLENLSLKFQFIGDSICSAYKKSPIAMEPGEGTLKPNSEMNIKLIYDPIQDGPLYFKVFCEIQYMTKPITFCVNALSFSINPSVTYTLHGVEHILQHDALTNIVLDQTASTYERLIPFKVQNQGSATFQFEWQYDPSCIKKYLTIYIEPKSGYLSPGTSVDCELHFTLTKVDVYEFPVTLAISDGPEYNIHLFAKIYHPEYHFTSDVVDFGKCFINMAENDYKKHIALVNDGDEPLLINLETSFTPEVFIDYTPGLEISPRGRKRYTIYFRPQEIKKFDLQVPYTINSLVHNFLTIKGEGIPLLIDVYEGCQRSYNLGPVKIMDTVTRTIDVMNHSDRLANVTFEFRNSSLIPITTEKAKSDSSSACILPNTVGLSVNTAVERVDALKTHMTGRTQEHEQENNLALQCLRVIPNKVAIKPHTKVPVRIKFKPTGFVNKLDVQLFAKVSIYERPLVRFNGRATGMLLVFNSSSLQFGRIRKYGRKFLKVMLMNKGDFNARFCWQPLLVPDFKISPMKGTIRAKSNVNFTIGYCPKEENPFVKVWACCNIDDYGSLELALYASCIEIGVMLNKTLAFETPVREKLTNYVTVTNPSDEEWMIYSEAAAPSFSTLREITMKPYSEFEIPITFEPETMGSHEGKIFYTGLGDSALFVTLMGAAIAPKPNATLNISVVCKERHTEKLAVRCITGLAETYVVVSEVFKIVPERLMYYEINYPDSVKVWGEADASLPWSFVSYAECEITMRVTFINKENREYQFYDIVVTVTPSKIREVVHITTRARETVTSSITVVNPVVTDQTFIIACDQISVVPELKIARKSEAKLKLVYSPLVVGQYEELLLVENLLLGAVHYKLLLECLPAKPKYMEVSTPIGTSTPIRMKVENLANLKADFVATTSHSCIILEKDYSLGPGEKFKFRATFEPVDIGPVDCSVTFTSPVAGEFVYKIKGTATNPEPQGPIKIQRNSFATIKFKNVFEANRTYYMYTDREEFYVKVPTELIKPKKETKIFVYMVDRPAGTTLPTGCLYVDTYNDMQQKIQWVYFLHGV